MRLLIVEDEPNLQRQLRTALEGAGYAVDTASDGEDGHYLGSTENYDAVILDLGLPEVDGLTVLDRWRKEGKTTPVLVLTARDSWSDKVAGLDAGMGYNTWPLMDGALVPAGMDAMQPGWRTLFENALTVQFIHRGTAYLVALYALFLLWRRVGQGGFIGVHGWLPRIGLLIGLQIVLGIATLLFSVPIPLALGHQALAFMLCGSIIAYLADMTGKTAR